jgi:diguanylate cyclase (GGDEF)-like protein
MYPSRMVKEDRFFIECENIPLPILIFDSKGLIYLCNKNLLKLLKDPDKKSIEGKKLSKIIRGKTTAIKKETEEVLHKGKNVAKLTTNIGFIRSIAIPVTLFLTKLEEDPQKRDLILGAAVEVPYNYKVATKLKYMAAHDELTGLHNRREFNKSMHKIESSGQKVGIISVDIDDLKKVNDSEGHAAGDKLIQHTAEILKKTFRENDIISRVGGDEFVVLLHEANGYETKLTRARMIRTLNSYNKKLGVNLGLSVGTSTWSSSAKFSIQEALDRADKRLRDNKRTRKAGRA